MNNFRQHQSKPFGNRGSDLPNPWMSEEEISNMRRQNPHFQPVMQIMNPNMHSPLLNQSTILSASAKTFMNPNSCKMSNTNFTHSPNPDIFKSSHSVNELSYPNRFMDSRFSHVNLQHKMNEGPLFKDYPTSNMISPRTHKNEGFSDISKPLLPNMRQPQERLSCMQNDQTQFHTKYDNSPIFQGKEFNFPNQKESQLQSDLLFNERVPVSIGSNLPSQKPNFRAPNLFPAYTPKENSETSFQNSPNIQENVKNVHNSVYSSDFVGKCSNFYDKTSSSPRYSKTMEPFHEKTDSYQERNLPVNEVFSNKSPFMNDSQSLKAMANSPVPQDSYKTMNPQVSHDSFKNMSDASFRTMANSQGSHDSFKTIPNSVSHDPFKVSSPQVSQADSFKTIPNPEVSLDSFKTLENKVTVSNSKYSFSSDNQQPCFQSSNEVPFHRSQNMSVSDHPTTTVSRDCLMQNAQFSSQSDANQNTKETFSSFNFESNINSTDLADLLPGLDAFLKETLNKSEETLNKHEDDVLKNDFRKTSVQSCAFSDDEWSKHSIPFIGDNQASSNGNQDDIIKVSYRDQATGRERCDKFELSSEKTTELKLTDINQSSSDTFAKPNREKGAACENEETKVRSQLEDAIDQLVTSDPIVGLDYITEYQKNLSQQGSFPFRCKLCNSGINRQSIIDHIVGSKHRMRYLKIKNERLYESIVSLKVEKSEKDAKIAEAAFHMETVYGRGHVIVNTIDSPKGLGVGSSWKESSEGIEPIFTLDKIPTIGFEALSPQLDEINSADFSLVSELSHEKQDTNNITQKENTNNTSTVTEVKRELPSCSNAESVDQSVRPSLDVESSACDIKPDAISKLLENIHKSGAPKVSDEESGAEFQHSSESSQIKRSVSPESSFYAKKVKTEPKDDEVKPCSDLLTTVQEPMDFKTDHSLPEREEFDIDILDMLSKSEISSEEEASVAVKVIGMLMQMYLRYKLQHLPLDKVENLMKLLQIKSPEQIEELKSLLKGNKILEEIEDKGSLEENKTVLQNKEEKTEHNLSSCMENNKPKVCEPTGSVSILNNSGPIPASTSNIVQPVLDVGQSNMTAGVPANSQVGNSVNLRPPPFFSWPQTSESLTNVSYATVQGTQNMMWSTAYQHSQAQYASQLSYYQPQNYGSTFSGTQAYQAQFPILPQSGVSMAQPPLPPPPPPPPPANPPLPPSVALLHNAPRMHLYSKNQPPPPPLP